jgi:hypothetical protein
VVPSIQCWAKDGQVVDHKVLVVLIDIRHKNYVLKSVKASAKTAKLIVALE